jgi:hypothetical protein
MRGCTFRRESGEPLAGDPRAGEILAGDADVREEASATFQVRFASREELYRSECRLSSNLTLPSEGVMTVLTLPTFLRSPCTVRLSKAAKDSRCLAE